MVQTKSSQSAAAAPLRTEVLTTQNDSQLEVLDAYAILEGRPFILFLVAFVSVVACCMFSQQLVNCAKQSNLALNKFYVRKRFEKQ